MAALDIAQLIVHIAIRRHFAILEKGFEVFFVTAIFVVVLEKRFLNCLEKEERRFKGSVLMDKRVKNSVEGIVLANGWLLSLNARYRINRVFMESAALNTCYTNARLEFFRSFACVCHYQNITRVNVHLIDQIVRFSNDSSRLSTTGCCHH